MVDSVRFIDRELELAQILDAVQDWDSRTAVFIQGGGGVGKTRFVSEVFKRLKSSLHPVETVALEERPMRLGVVMLTCQTGWGKQFLTGCREMAASFGAELTVIDCARNLDQMVEKFTNLSKQHLDAILVDLGRGEAMQTAIDEALARGEHVLAVASDLHNEKLIEIVLDDLELGHRSLLAMFEEIDGQGKIAILYNPGPAPLEMRRRELNELLARYPRVSLTVEIGLPQELGDITDQSVPNPQLVQRIKQALEIHPDLKAIWASTGEYGLAAMQAFDEAGRQDVLLYSVDFDERIRQRMSEPQSPWMFTVASDPAEIGRVMVRVAIQAAYGEKTRAHYTLPFSSISQEQLRAASLEIPISGKWITNWGHTGVGWSPWLHNLSNRQGAPAMGGVQQELLLSDAKGQRLLVLNIIDLDDIRLHSPQDIAWMLIQQVGAEHFKPYLNSLQELHAVERSSPDQYLLKRKIVETQFLESLSGLFFGFRTLLFCDTTDAATSPRGKEVLAYLTDMIGHLNNAILILSGRNTKELYDTFSQDSARVNKLLIELRPFDLAGSREYLAEKQKQLHQVIDPGLAEKLLFLADGRPILIDLAVELPGRTPLEPWLTSMTLESLKALPEKDLTNIRQRFEETLVSHIEQLRTNLDRLILTLAWVNPIDEFLCSQLLDMSLPETAEFFASVQNLSIIKTLPDGRIKLHDYVQEMILRDIWPKIEADRKQRDSNRAAEYFAERIISMRATLPVAEEASVVEQYRQREYWQTAVQWLHHALIADPLKGTSIFCQLFDEATAAYRIQMRQALVEQETQVFEDLPSASQYQVAWRWIVHLNDTGQYEPAEKLAQAVLKLSLEPAQRLDILTRLANAYQRLGLLKQSAACYEEALALSKNTSMLSEWIVKLENNLGQIYRQLGDLEVAVDYYQKALDGATMDIPLTASILNNLGFVLAQQGQYEIALEYCIRALEIRQQSKLVRDIGGSFATIGEIYRNSGDYEKALVNYQKALEIFEPEGEVYWLARLHGYRGAIYRLQRQYPEAIQELNRSLAYKGPLEQAWSYHVLGCVYMDQGQFEKALEYFALSDEIAQQLKHVQVMVNNLVTTTEVYYGLWVEQGRQDPGLPEKIEEYSKRLVDIAGQGYPHHQSRLQRVLGDMKFDEGNFDEALQIYIQAYAQLGSREAGYGQRTFTDELAALSERIVTRLGESQPDLAKSWCRQLRAAWENKSMLVERRGELLGMCRLCEIDLLMKG